MVIRRRDDSYPARGWIVHAYRWAYGKTDARTVQATHEIWSAPKCCKDEAYTLETHLLMASEKDPIDPAIAEQQYASSRNKEVFNANVDRHQIQDTSVTGVFIKLPSSSSSSETTAFGILPGYWAEG